MTYIYRIKHIPTGLYFKTCGPHAKNSLDIAGQLYISNYIIHHNILNGKNDYCLIILRKSFKYYNEFKKKYEYREITRKKEVGDSNNKDIKYSKFKIPRHEFKAEIFEIIENE